MRPTMLNAVNVDLAGFARNVALQLANLHHEEDAATAAGALTELVQDVLRYHDTLALPGFLMLPNASRAALNQYAFTISTVVAEVRERLAAPAAGLPVPSETLTTLQGLRERLTAVWLAASDAWLKRLRKNALALADPAGKPGAGTVAPALPRPRMTVEGPSVDSAEYRRQGTAELIKSRLRQLRLWTPTVRNVLEDTEMYFNGMRMDSAGLGAVKLADDAMRMTLPLFILTDLNRVLLARFGSLHGDEDNPWLATHEEYMDVATALRSLHEYLKDTPIFGGEAEHDPLLQLEETPLALWQMLPDMEKERLRFLQRAGRKVLLTDTLALLEALDAKIQTHAASRITERNVTFFSRAIVVPRVVEDVGMEAPLLLAEEPEAPEVRGAAEDAVERKATESGHLEYAFRTYKSPAYRLHAPRLGVETSASRLFPSDAEAAGPGKYRAMASRTARRWLRRLGDTVRVFEAVSIAPPLRPMQRTGAVSAAKFRGVWSLSPRKYRRIMDELLQAYDGAWHGRSPVQLPVLREGLQLLSALWRGLLAMERDYPLLPLGFHRDVDMVEALWNGMMQRLQWALPQVGRNLVLYGSGRADVPGYDDVPEEGVRSRSTLARLSPREGLQLARTLSSRLRSVLMPVDGGASFGVLAEMSVEAAREALVGDVRKHGHGVMLALHQAIPLLVVRRSDQPLRLADVLDAVSFLQDVVTETPLHVVTSKRVEGLDAARERVVRDAVALQHDVEYGCGATVGMLGSRLAEVLGMAMKAGSIVIHEKEHVKEPLLGKSPSDEPPESLVGSLMRDIRVKFRHMEGPWSRQVAESNNEAEDADAAENDVEVERDGSGKRQRLLGGSSWVLLPMSMA